VTRKRKLITGKYRRGIIGIIKDVRAKIFLSIDFLNFLLQSDNELLVSKMQKQLRVTDFVSEVKGI